MQPSVQFDTSKTAQIIKLLRLLTSTYTYAEVLHCSTAATITKVINRNYWGAENRMSGLIRKFTITKVINRNYWGAENRMSDLIRQPDNDSETKMLQLAI